MFPQLTKIERLAKAAVIFLFCIAVELAVLIMHL